MSTLNSRLQLSILNRKKGKNLAEKGFTLVELMIVIVIVGVLSAVALPNFLNQRDKAEAQSLIGSMAAFGKQCGGNMVIEDPVDVPDVPATITFTAGTTSAESGAGVPCDGGANVTISNSTAFPRPANIGGVRCGDDQADGTEATCALVIDQESGTITGTWS